MSHGEVAAPTPVSGQANKRLLLPLLSIFSAMTREHLFFIPIVLCLGIVLGSQVTHWRLSSSTLPVGSRRTTLRGLLIPLGAFLLLFVLTHVLSLHGGAKAVGDALGGQPIFDQRASFSAEEVYARLAAFGPAGRETYQRMTYTTDFAFPAVLLAFLIQLSRFVAERSNVSPLGRSVALLVPVSWALADLAENAMVFQLIDTYPIPNQPLAGLLGIVTSTKFSLLLAAVATPALLSVTAQRPLRGPHQEPPANAPGQLSHHRG